MREGVECFQVMNNKPELMSLLKFISRFNIFTPTREKVSRKLSGFETITRIFSFCFKITRRMLEVAELGRDAAFNIEHGEVQELRLWHH